MSYDRAPATLRASDADREAAAERLRVAAGEGRLDADELEQRLADAYGARYCTELGRLTADVTPPPARPSFVRPVHQPTNGFAVASLIVGLIWMWGIGSGLAVLFGHIALNQLARSGGTQAGRGVAVVGLVLGYAGLLGLLLIALTFVRG